MFLDKQNKETNRQLYRALMQGRDISYTRIFYKTADIYVGSEKDVQQLSQHLLETAYKQVEEEIEKNPAFLHSLTPLTARKGAQEVPLAMYVAAQKANVGPMAAVAGAIAEYISENIYSISKNHIIENGGDLYIHGDKERTIMIYAGNSPLSGKIGLKIAKELLPISVCTSSATFGHSLSLGKADAAIVLSKSGALADAAASTLGNLLVSKSKMQSALEKTAQIEGVLGAVGIIDEALAAWGCAQFTKIE